MALTQEALNEAKLAEAKITSAQSLSDDYKKTLLNLITISTTATNGISQEEKIQKMTEAIRILAISQVDFVTTIQNTIVNTIKSQHMAQCQNCKALKHANEVEEQEELEKLHAKWEAAQNAKAKQSQNSTSDQSSSTSITVSPTPITFPPPIEEKLGWTDTIKQMICQPGFWVFATLALLSPYTLDIIKTLTNIFSK